MRRRGRAALVTCAVMLVASGLSGVGASPASAAVFDFWTFDQRVGDFPASADPARTVESAYGQVSYDSDGAVGVHVRLGDVADEASAAVAHAAFGSLDDTGSCVTAWETSAPTWDPAGDPAGASQEVVLTGGFAVDGGMWDCGRVWLTSTDDAETYDRLDGRETHVVIADPGGWVRIGKVTGHGVRVHRWQKVRLRLTYRGSPARGVQVRGKGHDVRVRTARIDLPLEDGQSVWVAARVRLDVAHRRRVLLDVSPYGDLAFPGSDSKVVWLRPVRH